MNRVVLFLLLVFCCWCVSGAQSFATKVTRLEVDEKEVDVSYEVFLLVDGKWQEAERTSTGFVVPTELNDQEHFSILFVFCKYRLEFSRIHTSKFGTDWIVGVDTPPFSEDLVEREEMQNTKRVYYIIFQSKIGLDTRLVVTETDDE